MTSTPIAAGARRTAWVPLVAGVLCGVITVLIYGALVGVPVSGYGFALLGGFGLVIGVVSMGLVLLAASLTERALRAFVTAGAASIVLAAVAAWVLTRGYYLVPMVIAAAVTVVMHALAARAAAVRHGAAMLARESRAWRTTRLLLLIGSGFIALILSIGAVGMLREQLHVGCSYLSMGQEPGDWVCSDGIGYIFPGLTLLFGSGAALLVAVVVLLAASDERIRRIALTALAFVPLLWAAGWLSAVTLTRTDPLPSSESWPSIWFITVGISALLALAGATLAALTPAHRPAHLLWIAAGALLLAATIVQPGLALATIPSASLLVAARLIPLVIPVSESSEPGGFTAG